MIFWVLVLWKRITVATRFQFWELFYVLYFPGDLDGKASA